jgi:hypothetical protein
VTVMTIDVDESYETNMRVLKGVLYRLVESVREVDPHKVHAELVAMWLRHPVKAAQLMMALAIGLTRTRSQPWCLMRAPRKSRG